MDNCYLCGETFNDNDVRKHDEHIIQQAIGGALTANDILCANCGDKLGKDIDVPFNKIFEGISTRLDIKRDRKNNKKSSVKGTYVNLKYKFRALSFTDKMERSLNLLDYQYQYSKFCNEIKEIDVLWQNFKVYPLKPFYKYNNNIVTIYGQKKNIKQYRKKANKEIQSKYDQNINIVECDDLTGLVEFPFNMNDNDFKRGLAKIAIGFASKLGVKRDEMPLVLDASRKKIKDKINSLPFYPFGVFDKFIELQKSEFEHYPFHNLILFTLDYPAEVSNKKILICYIELFSTFQWYIVLNDEYSGQSIPYEYYAQQILKKDDYKVELGRRYYKERNIWLQPLGITEDIINKRYLSQARKFLLKFKWSNTSNYSIIMKQEDTFLIKSRFKIEEELIQEETIKQKYKFNFEGYIEGVISGILLQKSITDSKDLFENKEYYKSDIASFLSNSYLVSEYETIGKDLNSMTNFMKNMQLFFNSTYDRYDNLVEEFNINSYRIVFYENEELNFYPLLKSNDIELGKYHHLKFYMLEDYIQKENFKRKFQND